MKIPFNKYRHGKLYRRVRGLVKSIPYEVRLADGDKWSNYFGNFEGQRYGYFDTYNCWNFAGIESLETQLEWLYKNGKMPAETIEWLTKSGYIDEDGDFYLSRRWGAILSGVKDAGNDTNDFWSIASKAGVIPNKMLPYEVGKDGFMIYTREDFIKDYFNPKLITKDMELMGLEFLKRFKIDWAELGKRHTRRNPVLIQSALRQCPLEIAIPVTQNWNIGTQKQWDGRTQADHAVELYDYVDGPFPYKIYDSYEPHLKELSEDYYIPWITCGLLTCKPTPIVVEEKKTFYAKLWEAIYNFLTGKPIPANYPIG